MTPRRALGVLVLSLIVLGAACRSGPPPALRVPQTVPRECLLLSPEVRVGERRDDQLLVTQVAEELRAQLQARGFSTGVEAEDGPNAPLRRTLLDLLLRLRGAARLRTGAEAGVLESLRGVTDAGWQVAVVVRLAGYVPEPGVGVPMPADAVMPDRERGPDYVIPRAPGVGPNAVALDLLAVDGRSGKVVAHRRVAMPVDTPERLKAAIPSLVRESLRGLTP
jgi:hypothetical protein